MGAARANIETVSSAELSDGTGSLFAIYTPPQTQRWSQLVVWLPIVLASMASVACAIAFCPVPLPRTLSPRAAILIAIVYVAVTVVVGAGVLALWNYIAAGRRGGSANWQVMPLFCAAAAWLSPTVAFLARDSFWSVVTAAALAVAVAHLIWQQLEKIEMAADGEQHRFAKRRVWLTLAGMLLQLGVVSTLESKAHAAAFLVGTSVLTIWLFRGTSVSNRSIFQRLAQPSFSLLAILLVAASLIPYLAAPRSEGSEPGSGGPESRNAASLSEILQSLLARVPPSDGSNRPRDRQESVSAERPYPMLQRLFGEQKAASEQKKKQSTPESVTLVSGEIFPGIILRPRPKNDMVVAPPIPTRRLLDRRPNQRSVEPFSIPFDGVYWFFRRSDGTLPADAIEMQGDADSTALKTADYTAMKMEAHQYLGSQIDLSCCRAVEVVIANADRRPDTVQAELVLRDTAVAGKPEQSLGTLPVNSTLHWYPGDNRPAVTEVLKFPLPAGLTMHSFDEITVRFHLHSPRERFSAKNRDCEVPVAAIGEVIACCPLSPLFLARLTLMVRTFVRGLRTLTWALLRFRPEGG